MDLVRDTKKEVNYLCDILYYQLKDIPEKVAIIYRDKSYTYSSLYSFVAYLSQEINTKYGQASHIAIMLPRSIHYIVAYFAATFLGSKIVPIDPGLTIDEIRRTIEYCDVDLLIVESDNFENLNGVCENIYFMNEEYLIKESLPNTENNGKIKFYNNPDDFVLLLHTSGSIDLPKRVMLSHRNIIENAKAHVIHMNLSSEDCVLIALPMHFGYCNTAQLISHLMLGGTIVIMEGIFSPHRFFNMVQKYNVNVFTAVPTMLVQLSMFKHASLYDFKSLHQITFGGAPMPQKLIERLKQIFTYTSFCQTYGLTEAGPRLTGVSPINQKDSDIYTAGTCIPGVEMKIINEEGEVLENNTVGEIIVKSPGVMKGYYKRSIETEQVLKNGWLYTGDLGYFNNQNELQIVGRKKNIIIRGGVNIYPEEIETYLLTHPKVKAVLVSGVEHPGLGEVPFAHIVIDGEINVSLHTEMSEYCVRGLASYKIPTINFVKELPLTYNNKIKRGITINKL